MQTLRSPLRRHWELIDDDDQDEKDAIEAKAAALRDAFEVVDGMRIGRAIDIRHVDGSVRGPVANEADTEPLDDDIDTGFRFKDFQKGQFTIFPVWLHSLSVFKEIECSCFGGTCGGVRRFTRWPSAPRLSPFDLIGLATARPGTSPVAFTNCRYVYV
jgi:hypothetical protein